MGIVLWSTYINSSWRENHDIVAYMWETYVSDKRLLLMTIVHAATVVPYFTQPYEEPQWQKKFNRSLDSQRVFSLLLHKTSQYDHESWSEYWAFRWRSRECVRWRKATCDAPVERLSFSRIFYSSVSYTCAYRLARERRKRSPFHHPNRLFRSF